MNNSSVVVITGAAGALGSAAVDAFLGLGFRTFGIDLRPSEHGSSHHRAVEVDVRDEGLLGDALRDAATWGPVQHVIGIAGGALPDEPKTQDDPSSITMALARASVELNLLSQFALARAAVPMFDAAGGRDRSLTFTSSFNALSAQGMPAYSAAKAGLTGLMQGLVRPLGARGIRVNVVAPGTIRTPRTEHIWGHVPGHFERLEAGTALGRLGTPEDVADAFVAVTTLRHLTGQVLVVDGGQTVL